MSEITIYENNTVNNNFEMEKSDMVSKSCYMEEPITFNDNCIYPCFSKTDFSNLTSKEKAIALHYTQNTSINQSKFNNSSRNNVRSNESMRSGNKEYTYSHWSNSTLIPLESEQKSTEFLDDLAQNLKLYKNDISHMIKDLFCDNSDLDLYDVEELFKYSLIVGKKECSISEKLVNTLSYLSKCLANKTQEVNILKEKITKEECFQCYANLKQASSFYETSDSQLDNFNRECLVHLEEVTKQIDSNENCYQQQIHELLSEIRQRDELLDCYQKRENFLFNSFYPNLIERMGNFDLSGIPNKMNQQLCKVESAFQEELDMKSHLIEEIKNQKVAMEASYIEKLRAKDEIIHYLKQQSNEKEQNYQSEISKHKSRSAAQAKLAEQIRSQIQSQQIEYCKKIEDMQQDLDSRGKIIAYVKNKLNIRENELKIANIKYTTAERQMNIEKEQYKREITNLKEELEKTNEDIDDLENELDTLEDNLLSDHKDEMERLEKEHDLQLNKLWNIIDQRENTINTMEDQMDELNNKIKKLEKALSKYEEIVIEPDEESEVNNERDIVEGDNEEALDDMNERSNITMTGDASEELIILEEEFSENSKISEPMDCNSCILTSDLIEDEEGEKTGLTTDEQTEDEETNSLTLTEELSTGEESEMEERREFIEEEENENKERREIELENEIKTVKEENEQLRCQLEIIKQSNFDLKQQLQIEKEKLQQENEKCSLQQQECEALTLQNSQLCREKEEINERYQHLANEKIEKQAQGLKMEEEYKASLEQQKSKFQKERANFESRLKHLEEALNGTVSKEQYASLQKELDIALDNVNEQRRKKNYLKQKLANQNDKNKALVELIKKERIQNKEEIRQLKQSCVKQNGKIKAILKQVKDGFVTNDHIDLDRIVKRMKSERLLMNNEYERLKKVASTLSIKSTSSKKQPIVVKNGSFTDYSLNYKGSRKDLSHSEGSIDIKIKNSKNSNLNQNSESKILIKVASSFEPFAEDSIISKQANDSLNSIDSNDNSPELEEFNLKKALSQVDNSHYPEEEEEEDQNSFVDFTSPSSYDFTEKKDEILNQPSFNSKESISLILGDGSNKMTPQQVDLYNRILQIPGVMSINANGVRNFEIDDSNFSITSENSLLKDGEGYIDKRGIGLEVITNNRNRYNSFPKNEFKSNSHASLRRMPNFDQIAKLTQIKIKHSTEEIIV